MQLLLTKSEASSAKHHLILIRPFAQTLSPFLGLVIIIVVTLTIGIPQIFLDAKKFQVVSCFRPILGLLPTACVGSSSTSGPEKQTLLSILPTVGLPSVSSFPAWGTLPSFPTAL